MSISPELRDLYSGQYRDGRNADWRRIGAVGKAANICRAWDSVSARAPRVVELGCGDGAIANRLSNIGFFDQYVGLDISESGIAQACSRDVPKAQFKLIQGSSVPLESDSADLVVVTHVLEHLENPRDLLKDAHRIAPHLIAEVPLERHARMAGDYDWHPVGHINKFDQATFRHLVQTCRFDVLDQFTSNVSLEVMQFSGDRSATIKWIAREIALRAAAPFARQLFTYHSTLVALRNRAEHSWS